MQNRFATAPEIYKQFLEILQTYQRESKPIQDVYAQVTQLFNSAPDLLEDFKQFLPESAAHARQQAARQAEEAIPLSHLRGDPNYPNAQVLQGANRDVKMPPMGQFNVKDSAKEGKKRRGGPAPGGLVSSAADTTRMDSGRAGGPQAANANKVSKCLMSFNLQRSSSFQSHFIEHLRIPSYVHLLILFSNLTCLSIPTQCGPCPISSFVYISLVLLLIRLLTEDKACQDPSHQDLGSPSGFAHPPSLASCTDPAKCFAVRNTGRAGVL